MKNPDEIITGLRCCADDEISCHGCPYLPVKRVDCFDRLMVDALHLIEQLEMDLEVTRMNLGDTRADLQGAHDETHRLMKSLKVARAERDAARGQLARIAGERYREYLKGAE